MRTILFRPASKEARSLWHRGRSPFLDRLKTPLALHIGLGNLWQPVLDCCLSRAAFRFVLVQSVSRGHSHQSCSLFISRDSLLQSWSSPSVVFSSSVVSVSSVVFPSISRVLFVSRGFPSSVVAAPHHRSCRRWYPYLIHTHSCAGLSRLAEWAGFFDAALPASPKVLARRSASSNTLIVIIYHVNETSIEILRRG